MENENMKQTYIKIPHKCGSTIMGKIFKYGSNLCSHTYRDLDHINNSHDHESSLQEIVFTRHIKDLDQTYTWSSINNDKHLFVVRHPLARLISAYYSFGWTHGTKAAWIQDVEERKKVSAAMIRQKEIIQKTNLDDYIIDNLGSQIDNFISNCIQKDKTTCTCILPYEMFIIHPSRFIKTAFDFLSMSDVVEGVIDKFKDQLTPVEDRTDEIINNDLKTHRRTSDIHEWKTKLDINYISDKVKNINSKYIDRYTDFLASHDIK